MALFLIAYLAGILTIASPCILPVLPFVFARSDRPFVSSGLPLLVGMALTFALVGTLGAVGGGWAVTANEYARDAALVLMALFGLALLFPAISDRLTRPIVALGAKLSESVDARNARGDRAVGTSLLLGVATGFLWAPCAGPILGLILTGAALQGVNAQTSFLLLAYALGAATALAVVLFAGGKVFAAMKRSLGAGEWIRRGLGALVLVAVVAIFYGLDTGLLTRLSIGNTAGLEQKLLDASGHGDADEQTAMTGGPGMMMSNNAPGMMMGNGGAMAMKGQGAKSEALQPEGLMPPLTGAVTWLNSPELTTEELRGKVILVDFWTYSCINCLRSVPYVRAWAEKYKDKGLVVIGVHAPEFAFEKNLDNVRKATADLGVTYPVAIDNNLTIWRAFNNAYWPAHYFIDANGVIRHHHFGEGQYEESERVIQKLVAEAGAKDVGADVVAVNATGAEAPPAIDKMASPETYIGYERAENFVSPDGAVKDASHVYTDGAPRLNEWGLVGAWTIGSEHATANSGNCQIVYRFQARDLHLVLGPSADGKAVRFKITLDGKPPGGDHGVDVDANGMGTVTRQKLYQLVRQKGAIGERTFTIEFLDPGAEAFAFTFG